MLIGKTRASVLGSRDKTHSPSTPSPSLSKIFTPLLLSATWPTFEFLIIKPTEFQDEFLHFSELVFVALEFAASLQVSGFYKRSL